MQTRLPFNLSFHQHSLKPRALGARDLLLRERSGHRIHDPTTSVDIDRRTHRIRVLLDLAHTSLQFIFGIYSFLLRLISTKSELE